MKTWAVYRLVFVQSLAEDSLEFVQWLVIVFVHVQSMRGSRKFSQGGPPSDQEWSNKFYHCKDSYFGKSRGGDWTPPSPPLDPPMQSRFASTWINAFHFDSDDSWTCFTSRIQNINPFNKFWPGWFTDYIFSATDNYIFVLVMAFVVDIIKTLLEPKSSLFHWTFDAGQPPLMQKRWLEYCWEFS